MITVTKATAPTIFDIKGFPKDAKISVVLSAGEINIVLKKIKVNGESFAVKRLFDPITASDITVAVSEGETVAMFIRPQNKESYIPSELEL